MSNMTIRILVGAAAIPLILWIISHGGFAFVFFLMTIAGLAQYELYTLARRKGIQPQTWTGIISGLLYLLVSAPHLMLPIPPNIVLGGLLVFAFAWEVFRKRASMFANAMTTVGGMIYIPVSLSFLLETSTLSAAKGIHGGDIVTGIFVAIWLCDSGAYFVGKFFGRRPLLERASPKKTWEGAVGGFVVATVGTMSLLSWTAPQFPMLLAAAVGGVAGIFGQIGDLFESLIKRDIGVKDSSAIIPGHGGMLDRFDSMFFTAPAVYIVLRFFW